MCRNLSAQEPYYIPIDKNKGLISQSVYDIFQDSRGFIWIAHDEGLSRYDGTQFKNYTSDAQTSRAGSSIKEDKFGRIWYENFDGCLYYVERDSLKALLNKNSAGYNRFGILEDRLLFIEKDGVVFYDLQHLKPIKKINCNLSTFSSSECSNNKFYLVTDTILVFDKSGIIDTINNHSKGQKIFPGVAMKSKNNMVLYARNGDFKACYQLLDKGIGQRKFNLSFKGLIQNESYTDNCYWFCTPNGAYGYKELGEMLNNGKPFFADRSISKVLKDKEGNYWFGTTNSGIFVVPDLTTNLYRFNFEITHLTKANSSLIIGSKTGQVYRLDKEDAKPLLIYDNNVSKEIFYLDYDSLEKLVMVSSSKFDMLDLQGKILWHNGAAIKSCCRMYKNFFSFAATGTAGTFALSKNPNEGKSPCFRFSAASSGNLTLWGVLENVRAKSTIYNSASTTIYYATNTGLYAVNTQCKQTELFFKGSHFYASQLQQTNTRMFALSTVGKVYEITNHQIKELKAFETFGTLLCQNIKIRNDVILLNTNQGVFYCNIHERDMPLHHLNMDANVSDIEIINNKVAIATDQGLVFTQLNNTGQHTVKPALVIDNVKANSHIVNTEKALKFNENTIEINFSLITYKNANTKTVFYNINGNGWQRLTNGSRALYLASLSPGEYVIEFATGQIQPQELNAALIKFTINKPWWKTAWAIAGFCLLVLSVFTTIYFWQTSLLKKKNQLLQQKFELEKTLRQSTLKSIKAQMNPHFFYNALNTIQSFIFSNDKRSASTYLSKFSKLTRTILEMSEKEEVSLSEEIEALTLYLDIEKVRFDNDFNFKIEKLQEFNSEMLKIPSMLIQPYVENAIKHGLLHKKGDKNLVVNFNFENKLLTVLVSDNGIGRQRSVEINRIKHGKPTSFATQANLTRLSILNRDEARVGVEFIDKKDALGNSLGTDVILKIPIK